MVNRHRSGKRNYDLMVATASTSSTFNARISGQWEINIEVADVAVDFSRNRADRRGRERAGGIADERVPPVTSQINCRAFANGSIASSGEVASTNHIQRRARRWIADFTVRDGNLNNPGRLIE